MNRWKNNIKMNLRERISDLWVVFIFLGYGKVAGCCGHGNETLGSIDEEIMSSQGVFCCVHSSLHC
jgi:hypothetical protein